MTDSEVVVHLTPTELSVALSALWTVDADSDMRQRAAPRRYHQQALKRVSGKLQQAAADQLSEEDASHG